MPNHETSNSVGPSAIPPYRLMVVDDHTLFRRGLMALLGRERQFSVVADCADANQAQRLAASLQPDVILLDNHLPGVNGVDALPALHEAAPAAVILMLTVSEDAQDLAQALHAGAAGYLLKTMEGDELIAAIHRAVQGDSVIAPAMLSKLVAAYRDLRSPAPAASTAEPIPSAAPWDLSPRELDVLRGIARGQSNKEIAREHNIAETTVKIHVQHILRKLGVSSRVQAAVLATERGLG
ncbi:MAG: response regulator [Rhodoferax sp.]